MAYAEPPASGGGTSPLNAPFWKDDFEFNLVAGGMGALTYGELNWDYSGGAVPGQSNSEQYHPGCGFIGCSASGVETILKGAFASINIANGTTIGQHSVKVSTLSNTGTDSFKIYLGIGLGSPFPDASGSGIWFSYTDTESSGNWQANTCDFAGVTTLDTGVAVVAGTWYDLSYKCTGTTSVEFFVNGVSVGTISTGLPASFNQAPYLATQWLTGNGGSMIVDCYYLQQILSTPRFTVLT